MFKRKKKETTTKIRVKSFVNDDKHINGYLNEETMLFGNKLSDSDVYKEVYNVLLDRMKNRLFTMFEYEGFDENIPSHLIESLLFSKGSALLYSDNTIDYVVNYSSIGKLDIYNEPIKFRTIYINGVKAKTVTNNVDCVVIKNNFTAFPTEKIVRIFLRRKAKNFSALEENIDTAINKWLVYGNGVGKQEGLKTAINKLKKPKEKVVLVPDETALKVGVNPFYEPFNSKEWWEDINNTNAFMLTELGIPSNVNEDKKERLVVDEVNIKKLESLPVYYSMVRSRWESIQRYNKLFNKNIVFKAVFDFNNSENMKESEDIENEK